MRELQLAVSGGIIRAKIESPGKGEWYLKKLMTIVVSALCAAVAFGGAAGQLPAGYTEVEYIQGNGLDARIVTDYKPVPGTDKIEAEVEFPVLDDKTMTIWCARGKTSTDDTWSLIERSPNGSTWRLRFDYADSTDGEIADFNCETDKRYKFVAEGSHFDVYSGGSRKCGYAYETGKDFTAGGPVVLFATYSDGADKNIGNWGKQKLYSFKVWRLGKLIHYFVPCKDSSGKAVMVDLCDNPSTLTVKGTFTAGGEGHYFEDSYFVHSDQAGKLPEGCVALEYIETTAENDGRFGMGLGDQYILLDYVPDASSVVEAKVAILDKNFTQGIFCARGLSNSENTFSLLWTYGEDPNRGFGWNYNCNDLRGGWNLVTPEIPLMCKCESAGLWVDGVKAVDTSSKGAPQSTGNMMLFATYSGGDTGNRSNYAKIRLYSFKAYDGGSATPTVDLVPCSNMTTHAVFLFDVANNRSYLNQGVTPFRCGRPRLFTVDPIADQQLVVPMTRPKPVVCDAKSGEVLVEGTHYALSYSGATNTFGTVEVSVTGIGEYAESFVVTVSYRNIKVPALKINDFAYTMCISPAADKVTEPLANFPVLVRLSAARQKRFDPAKCGTNGSELRFALEDGTILSHEVDYWTTDGDCCVWVNVPSLTADTKIIACWGHREGKPLPYIDPAETWPDFVGVWHFSEPDGPVRDSSGNGYDTTNETATVSSTHAKIGLSRETDGTRFQTGVTDLLTAVGKKNISDVQRFTVSGWMYENTGAPSWCALFNKGGVNAGGWAQNMQDDLTWMNCQGGDDRQLFVQGMTSLYGKWTHFEVCYAGVGNTSTCWVDGGEHEATATDLNATKSNHELTFLRSLKGYGDELRIRNGTVSEAWAKADYQNQATDTFLSYGKVTSNNGFMLIFR